MPTELQRVKKKRGGQKGNQNARTHGFYSSTLTPEEISQIWTLISQEHVSPDVAILRVKLMSMVHQVESQRNTFCRTKPEVLNRRLMCGIQPKCTTVDHRVLKEVVRIIVQWYAKKPEGHRP